MFEESYIGKILMFYTCKMFLTGPLTTTEIMDATEATLAANGKLLFFFLVNSSVHYNQFA